MLTRLPNWQSSLDIFFRDNATRPFQYGSFDCCLFACDAIEAMTGVDVAHLFRGRYSTRMGALAAVRKVAGAASVLAVAERITSEYEMPRVADPTTLRRGDVALIPRPRGDCSLGIVALNGAGIVVVAAKGLKTVPLLSACSGWRV